MLFIAKYIFYVTFHNLPVYVSVAGGAANKLPPGLPRTEPILETTVESVIPWKKIIMYEDIQINDQG